MTWHRDILMVRPDQVDLDLRNSDYSAWITVKGNTARGVERIGKKLLASLNHKPSPVKKRKHRSQI